MTPPSHTLGPPATHRPVDGVAQLRMLLVGAAGCVLTSSESHHSFGHDLVGETWGRVLS